MILQSRPTISMRHSRGRIQHLDGSAKRMVSAGEVPLPASREGTGGVPGEFTQYKEGPLGHISRRLVRRSRLSMTTRLTDHQCAGWHVQSQEWGSAVQSGVHGSGLPMTNGECR